MLSFEGMSIIKDTKMNGVGFTLLNVVSKSSFTLHLLSMVRAFKERRKESAPKEESEEENPVPLKRAASSLIVRVLGNIEDDGIKSANKELGSAQLPYEARFDMLDPDYQTFLKKAGVSSEMFATLGLQERVKMRSAFEDLGKRAKKQEGETLQGDVALIHSSDTELMGEIRRRFEIASQIYAAVNNIEDTATVTIQPTRMSDALNMFTSVLWEPLK